MNIMKLIEQTFHRTEGFESVRTSDLIFVFLLVAVGTVLRFWGLGNVGLHGDEETMAMPTLALLEQGRPYLPSGMYYPRALAQIYLMAGSVWIFGESEWALRVPSAIVGSLMPLLAYFLGRRFLSSPFNLLFVAAITFSPALIDYSQTARMYVFWLAALMVFGTCIFRWERKNSLQALVVALVAWLVALHFHALSILAAPIFLFPGLVRRSWASLFLGGTAIAVCAYVYKINGTWIGSHYPSSAQRPAADTVETLSVEPSLLEHYWAQYPILILTGALIFLAGVIWMGVRAANENKLAGAATFLFLALGFAACAALHYHVGVLSLLLGTVLWLRNSIGRPQWLLAVWGIVGAMALFQVFGLYQTGAYPGRKLIGAMVGVPSVWPVLRFSEYSPVAVAAYCVVLIYAIFRLASRRRIPDHLLFFAISVWAPLLAIGIVTWYLPPRYTAGVLPYFLLCCVAGFEYLYRNWGWVSKAVNSSRTVGLVIFVLIAIAISNPAQLRSVVNTDYRTHPDHKGAAEYLRNLPINDDDIIIAEDALQQTYYLGEVDYWLRNFENARGYAVRQDGTNVDQYTATPILGTGAELLEVLDKNPDKRIFIIGSGEIYPGQDEWARGGGIGDVLQLERLQVMYEGRDGLTKIWRDAK